MDIEHQKTELPIENNIDKWYGGEGRVHLVHNSKKESAADAKYYYMKVKTRGRGYDDLMMTEKEYHQAVYRASRNKEDIPKKMTIKDFFKTIFS